MMIRRSFSLVEVLISVALFCGALAFIMPPLQSASKMMVKEREIVEAQSAVEEAVHSFHVELFGHENLSFEQLMKSMEPKEINGFDITYEVVGTTSLQEKATQVAQLIIDVAVVQDDKTKPLAMRRIYVCVTTS